MVASQRFAVHYGVFRPLLTLVGSGPRSAYLEVDGDTIRARMGWSFKADFPRASITGVAPFEGRVTGIGVHGWRGQWLVNGSSRGLVAISIDPPAPAHVFGVPVKLRVLCIGLEEPERLITLLGG